MKNMVCEYKCGERRYPTLCEVDAEIYLTPAGWPRLTIRTRHYDGYTGEVSETSVYSSYSEYCQAETNNPETPVFSEWDMTGLLLHTRDDLGFGWRRSDLKRILGETYDDMTGAFPVLLK